MLTQKQLKAKAVIVLAVAMSFSAACGQNANVSGKSKSAAGALTTVPDNSDRTKKPPVPAETQADPNAPGNKKPVAPKPSVPPVVTAPVPSPKSEPKPEPKPEPKSEPKSEPKVIPAVPGPAGEKGKDGQDGKDGRDGVSGRDGCGNFDKPYEFNSKPFSKEEISQAVLPYLSKPHKIKTINVGQATAFPGVKVVTDGQVVMKFAMRLPPREAIHHVTDVYLELAVTKQSNDGYEDTEILCFIDQKICSGTPYTQATWQANKNPEFWGTAKSDTKATFLTEFKDAKIEKRGGKVWASDKLLLKIDDLITGSDHKDAISFLYDGAASNQRLVRDLRVVVADDIFVSSAKLVVDINEDTCRTNELDAQSKSKTK